MDVDRFQRGDSTDLGDERDRADKRREDATNRGDADAPRAEVDADNQVGGRVPREACHGNAQQDAEKGANEAEGQQLDKEDARELHPRGTDATHDAELRATLVEADALRGEDDSDPGGGHRTTDGDQSQGLARWYG